MGRALEPHVLKDNKLTPLATRDFCTRVIAIMREGSSNGSIVPGGSCVQEVPPDPKASERYSLLWDPNEFPEFHSEMVPTYEKMLQSLNVEVGVAELMKAGIPVFDPTAYAAEFGADLDPDLTFDDVIPALTVPADELPAMLGIEKADFAAALADVMSGLAPTIPPVPEVPEPRILDDFLDELFDFQMESFTSPIEAFGDLVAEMPSLVADGLPPDSIVEFLCTRIMSGFSSDSEDDLQAASYQAMGEGAIAAVAMAAVGFMLGPGGVIATHVFKETGGFTQELVDERESGFEEADDGARDDIPINRNFWTGIPKDAGNGKGIMLSTYQLIRDIGSRFISGDIPDEYKGLIIMCVLNNETGIDPGAHTHSGFYEQQPNGGYNVAAGHSGNVSDAFVFGLSVGAAAVQYVTIPPNEFKSIPRYGNGFLNDAQAEGMPLATQLDHYIEFLTRTLVRQGKLGSQFDRPHPGGGFYTGYDPGIVLDTTYLDRQPAIPQNQRGPALPNERPFLIEMIYDLYALHTSPTSTGYGIVFSAKTGAFKEAVAGGGTAWEIAKRTIHMIRTGEHVPAYMRATGMSYPIDWSKIVPMGVAEFLNADGSAVLEGKIPVDPNAPDGLKRGVSTILNDPSAWQARSAQSIDATYERVKARDIG